jgi:hypothetical protein
MFNIHTFYPDSIITVKNNREEPTGTLSKEVQAIWEAEQAHRGKDLFNDLLFSVQDFSEKHIVGQFVEYRLLIAQRIKPELYEFLRIRPLAVSGILHCSSGIVFGQRHASMTQDAGLWELVPSGGVSCSSGVKEKGCIDINQQLLQELYEETGMTGSQVSSTSPFCLVEDLKTHVIDIGIKIVTSSSADKIYQNHELCNNKEYVDLKTISIPDISTFLTQEKENIVEVSRILLQELGLNENP